MGVGTQRGRRFKRSLAWEPVEAERVRGASASLGAGCVDFIFSQFLLLPPGIQGELVRGAFTHCDQFK